MTTPGEQQEQESLDTEELENIKFNFNLIDVDHNNRISTSELGTMIRALGFNPSDKEIEDMVKKLDTNGSGVLEFDEFRTFYQKMKAGIKEESEPKKQMKAAFKVFDRNGNGYIERNELKKLLSNLNVTEDESEINEMIEAADSNKDGMISIDELTNLMCQPVGKS